MKTELIVRRQPGALAHIGDNLAQGFWISRGNNRYYEIAGSALAEGKANVA